MANEIKAENSIAAKKTRRAFVTTAAQVAVTAPAVAMLLSASTKPAAAGVTYEVTLPQEEPVLPQED